MDPVRNFCIVEALQGYSSSDTMIDLALNHGLLLPDPAVEGAFNLIWFNYTDYKNPYDDPYKEIIRVVSRSNDRLTILRAQENTPASLKNITGKTYKLMLSLTKKTMDELVSGRQGLVTGSTGGGSRGANSCDFQLIRSSASQVASGERSFIAGGQNNTVSGTDSLASGSENTLSGSASSVSGANNSCSGDNSAVSGSLNSCHSSDSSVAGSCCVSAAPARFSFARGYQSVASLEGEYAFSSKCHQSPGDCQYSHFHLSCQSGDGLSAILTSGPSHQTVELCSSSSPAAYVLHSLIIGQVVDSPGLVSAFELKSVLLKSGTVWQVAGTPSVMPLYTGIIDTSVDIDIINDHLFIGCGSSQETLLIFWSAFLELLKVKAY